MPKGLEIEKKYLIAYPDTELLREKGAVEKSLEQTYLTAEDGVSERVRKSVKNGVVTYTHTLKKKVSGITRLEDEKEITEEEYKALLLRADPTCETVRKTRFVLPGEGVFYEIDVFPFWKDKAFLEVELEREEQSVFLPDLVTVLADVSRDKNYTNHAIAKQLKTNETFRLR